MLPIHKKFIFAHAFLLILCLIGFSSSAAAIDFNANWYYAQRGGDGLQTEDEFRQRYSLGVGPTISYKPTHAITASAGISYSRTRSGDDRETSWNDGITPVARLSLFNDIFLADIAGSSTMREVNQARVQRAIRGIPVWRVPGRFLFSLLCG